MPHFTFIQNEDGTIRQTLKDGQPHNEDVALEQLYSVVTTYFDAANVNLGRLRVEEDKKAKRHFGLQAFLMGLTGIEAFTNTYFHLRAQELGSSEMLERIEQTHGSLSRKIVELMAMTPDGPLRNQDQLIERVFTLSQLRNEMVHPRWVPASLALYADGTVPLMIDGMVENRQRRFEDFDFCRDAITWCLLLIARVGQSRGHQDVSGFMFHWTGRYGLRLETLLSTLGLPPE